MSISTSIPKITRRRRSHPLLAIAAISAIIALATSVIASYVVDSGTRSGRSSAPTPASLLQQLNATGREYVLGVMSMTPVEMSAAFNTNVTSAPGRDTGRAQAIRSGAPSLASVLRSLTPTERRYVLGIASLTPLQLWAAFGTTPTPPVHRGGSASPSPSSWT